MAAADCNTCGWFKSTDRHDTACQLADQHEAKTGHQEIEVR
ncbi:hypothetical protein PBI_KESHU_93 [Mycobacterium phage Keshu]|uniref:Uncharacterized protein n=4 Tax=Keshuvirus TaxID=2948781 RepID=G1D4Z9_9CAUD|nr:hypothetical protein PBI_KESHU_93 [Mycobacterium phage Keshu]YP_009202724.1 hypothetical protein SEA_SHEDLOCKHOLMES_93 [Mycobacterium phage ShedlockHolmes]YP_009637428.1 hypothetical protein FGG30_gp090 [Mycobacterium phage Pixie]AOT23826.1 hypothetical protein SEA_TBOND007_87 [Mycobacterium phage TBond007]AEK09900.1 hypothetical protein PBI_PIXIE_90 [Mycobacterium phage Pixie]AJD82313.1 hypothetical protein PBI_KESHU_93 [Mycobacterium phage Keshu]AKF15270.1 hypothetical protein SEA_SHEDLO